jgi:hypothetical protein
MLGKYIVNVSSFLRNIKISNLYKSLLCRILAFSTVSLVTVEIQLDHDIWQKCNHIKGPLYVFSWNSTNYKEGIHHITV